MGLLRKLFKRKPKTCLVADQIFKVQISLMTSNDVPEVLIYNEDRSLEFICDLTKDTAKMMDGEYKKFFWGLYNCKTKEIELSIHEAEWQEW